MSDQISEKMARKLAGISAAQSQASSEYIKRETEEVLDAWRDAGLIKPSKLDEVREWVHKNEYAQGSEETARAYAHGVRACAAQFEPAIAEILEGRK